MVEDEVLVARDIEARLDRMGYEVVGTSATGCDAIKMALALRPQLILMDINLRGELDGIDTAERIRLRYDVPIIYCTAYSNDEVLSRARVSEPYGYVLKPFDNRELEISIEIALYKHHAEAELAAARQRLDVTLANINDGVIATTMSSEVCFLNQTAEALTGWSLAQAEGVHLDRVLRLVPLSQPDDTMLANRSPGEEAQSKRYLLTQPGGGEIPVEMNSVRLTGDEPRLQVVTFRDISQQIDYEKTIVRSAFFDDLTGLPNRSLFIDHLSSSIGRRARNQGEPLAVLFLDIDNFATVNDGRGHDLGDQLIRQFGERIAGGVRPEDTVSRFSSDIFAVLLDPVDSLTGAIQACQRLLEVSALPFTTDSEEIRVSASAGIVLSDGNGCTAEEILRDADNALHRSKQQSRGGYVVFDSAMYDEARQFMDRKFSMQDALLEGAFEVHYQPIVDIGTEQLCGMEALVRWPHPVEGMVPPSEFIPMAEETGLIQPLGEWVLRSVCEQIREWNGCGFDNFRVAVNLSACQFNDNIPTLVSRIIDESRIEPDSLGLEITEGVVMNNVEDNIRMLERLRLIGLAISIDDFGTGYSSLAYLKRFPLNTLKIDRAFITDLESSSDDREITRAIIAMGRSLNLKVLAEGVENSNQVEFLRENGCDYIQGYYYCKPLPAAEVLPYLREHQMVNGSHLRVTARAV